MDDQLMSYLLGHNNEEEIFARLREETGKLPGAGASMQVSPEQGKLLAFLVRICQAKLVIEVGVYTGYSSLSMARALPANGRLVACEWDPRWVKIASRYWEEGGVRDKVDARLGPALETLEGMIAAGETDTYDMAFLDADKRSYLAYFECLLKLIRPGGLIVVDNVLWHGKVADSGVKDKKTEALRQFNAFVAKDARVSTVMLPVGDGMTLCQRLS
ncbi:caffeoyl-CoA O-methyltransferase [Klebsormidium nitens]|uniref:Caffeoyl-CoA O-methyltransferase n=1 Tax=Klebsormidium nitens TaxID=105231 RepID=A0A1Y1IA85_KLENI|nr:caffeoyl-CoA O-methyltransferase [Klebsormidium nitens]|eukprot:GAQ85606.1 caffeoyl-CoA O-methyltransferase [Klebsormidium nitens]